MSPAARRACVLLALGSAVVALSGTAAAAEPITGTDVGGGAMTAEPLAGIGGKSTCPRPEAVWAALETLIPRDQLAHEQLVSPGASKRVEILDLGLRYRVIAAGRVREYRDDAHDCDHRARVAAVFVALALAPAYFGQPPTPPPTPPAPAPVGSPLVPATTPAVPPPPGDVAPPPGTVQVNLGASYVVGVSGDRHRAPALTLRLVAARAGWGLTAGVVVPLPSDATVNGLGLREFRLPVDAGVRAVTQTENVEWAGEAGLTVAWLSERAPTLAMSGARSAVEVGARLGLAVRLAPGARVAPFGALHVEVVPRPTLLGALPRGDVGHTPTLWVGVTAGVSLAWW